jgi:hypothetical protein
MKEMDQQKALAIMGLSADAGKDEISKRYGILTRKFRTIKTDENGYTIEDITQAYNLLMGITFNDEKEQQRQKALRENPPLLARILKKDPVKLENFFHYYKWYMIAGLAIIIIAFFSIRSCMNQVQSDFTMVLSGALYVEDETALEADIHEKLPELQAPQVHLLISNPSDGEYTYAIAMKQMAMLAAAEIDIILMDQSTYEQMSSQGMLVSLEDQMGTLPFPPEAYVKGAVILEEPMEGDPVLGPQTVYGVDITESNYVKENVIYGERIIAGIVANSKNMDKALALLSKME